LRPALGLTPGAGVGGVKYEPDETEEREVDEKRILGIMNDEDDDFPYDSDEEAMREIQLSQNTQATKWRRSTSIRRTLDNWSMTLTITPPSWQTTWRAIS